MAEENNNQTANDTKLVGLLAQFDDPTSLISACNNAREAGYTKTDAYSPFPVHGIDPAIGIKRSILPFIVLGVACGAVCIGLGMQWYTNKADWSPIFPGYAFKISGKPLFSLPANIPVTFEVIVLSSAFATFLGMWFLNKLPMLSNPLHRISRFKRATNDKFFLMIEERDGKFDRSSTEAQLNEWGAVAIEECRQDLTDNKLPSWLRLVALMGAILLLLPPVAIFRAMGQTNRAPRLHVMPDMDWQHKSKTQTESPMLAGSDMIFVDERAMRLPVEGSVSRGNLEADSEMYRGIKKDYVAVAVSTRNNVMASTSTGQDQDAAASAAPTEDLAQYVAAFPKGIVVNEELLKRGQNRFNIYCSVCHGYSGNGDGLVNQRAVALAATGKASWTSAKSLHDPIVKDPAQNPVGRIYDTITNGRNTMGPYKDQIPVADRWAIVAYVKALQETGIEPPVVVSDEEEETEEDAE
ncbi:MAG: quinol:electron acceptor oxidoreductase subunit ActD [Mariniblastus sp.]